MNNTNDSYCYSKYIVTCRAVLAIYVYDRKNQTACDVAILINDL